jgi:hypothetical protein
MSEPTLKLKSLTLVHGDSIFQYKTSIAIICDTVVIFLCEMVKLRVGCLMKMV